MQRDEVLRVGLIGCGEHARENLVPALWGLEGVQVVSVCDPVNSLAQATAAKFPTARVELDFQRMIDRGDIDAIVVAATPQVHFAAASKAIQNRIHVFVEKPPTEDRGKLEELISNAKQRNVITAVGHNLRHTRAAQEMQRRLGDRSFGSPIAMEMRYFASKPRGVRWGLSSELRSFLLSHANHAIDFMIFQMGPIRTVNAALKSGSIDGIALTAQFIFESGAVGTLFATSLAPHFAISGTITSDSGRLIQLNSLSEIVSFENSGDQKRWGHRWVEKTLNTGYESAGYSTELGRFFDSIRNDKVRFQPSFADELAVYVAMERIEEEIALATSVAEQKQPSSASL